MSLGVAAVPILHGRLPWHARAEELGLVKRQKVSSLTIPNSVTAADTQLSILK